MFYFLKNIFKLLKIFYLAEKYSIFWEYEKILPFHINFVRKIFILVFLTKNFFTKPKDAFDKRLVDLITKLGTIYIKFGQTLSSNENIIGKKIAAALRDLQDKLPAFEYFIFVQKFEDNFQKKVDNVFSYIEKTPMASASVAQVYKAILKEGERRVIIKCLRPKIYEIYEEDLKFLEFFVDIFAKIFKKFKRLKLKEVVFLFKAVMKRELDLRIEASSASLFKDNFQGDTSLYVPDIFWEYSCREILVMEQVQGFSIYEHDKMKMYKIDPAEVAVKLARVFFNQAYRDGFFHADLHPGNILISHQGNIILVDFGIVGTLSETDRFAIAEILYALLRKKYSLVAKIHQRVGYIPKNTDLVLFAQSCRSVAEPIVEKNIQNISIGQLLSQLFEVTEEFGMETQIQLVLLQKTLVVLEGVGHILCSESNIWHSVEPWIKKWAIRNLTPEAKIMRYIKNFFVRLN